MDLAIQQLRASDNNNNNNNNANNDNDVDHDSVQQFCINWKPFFLSTTIPDEGEDLKEYLAAKYGSPATFDNMVGRLQAAGGAVGCKFTYTPGAVCRITPTLDSHRLLAHASRQQLGHECAESIFAMHFAEEKRLSSRVDLVRAAERAGVTGAAAYLETNEDRDEVLYDAKQWKGAASPINGVPHFFIYARSQPQHKVSFSGAQPPEMFLSAFRKVLKAVTKR